VAAVGLWPTRVMCAPPQQMQQEIVVTATRESDAALTAKVTAALQQNPYIFSDHLQVTTQNGVVRITGVIRDLSDLLEVLRIARRSAGKGHVVNEIEYIPIDDDGN
jgi:osmotically-inducible protein OsmY